MLAYLLIVTKQSLSLYAVFGFIRQAPDFCGLRSDISLPKLVDQTVIAYLTRCCRLLTESELETTTTTLRLQWLPFIFLKISTERTFHSFSCALVRGNHCVNATIVVVSRRLIS
ncbi:hypothetical protein ISCGN_002279 [Ixodes scapularis]